MTASKRSSSVPSLDDYPASPRTESRKGGWRSHLAGKNPNERSVHPASVSVVTVVRNGVVALPRALESVRSQDADGVEHVVVDGNSQDGTQGLLLSNDERIALWVSEPDRGISDAFNKGIALSRGEIIGLLNSDDWYEAGAIRAVLEKMQETGADIVCGNLQYWEGPHRTYLTNSDPEQLSRAMTVGHPTVFVRRDCYRRLGLFRLDFKLAMDYEWMLRAKTAGARIAVVDRCLANMQGGGVGDRLWRDSQREVAKARALHLPGADNAFSYHSYVWRRILMGIIRRALDATGLGVLRRAYHRWLSPVRVISNRNGFKD
ncbi:MAG: glycosyltransferase family 2 protein [Betaproteobacteria bacterium]